MTAGPELDLAVAKACGIEPRVVDKAFRIRPAKDYRRGELFCPSTDLNDAFLAAGKIGLFDQHAIWRLSSQRWQIISIGETWDRDAGEIPVVKELCDAETAPLAICAAILQTTGNL